MSFGGLTITFAKPTGTSSTLAPENSEQKVQVHQEPDGIELLGEVSTRKIGDKVHFCTNCNFPIVKYGRLHPCQHAFCYTCAHEVCRTTQNCLLCSSTIVELEEVESSSLVICARCLVSFPDVDELRHHMKLFHQRPPAAPPGPPPGQPQPPPPPMPPAGPPGQQRAIPPPRPPEGLPPPAKAF